MVSLVLNLLPRRRKLTVFTSDECGVWFDNDQASEKLDEAMPPRDASYDPNVLPEHGEDASIRNRLVRELPWNEQEELDFLKNIKVVDIVDVRVIAEPGSIIYSCRECGTGFTSESQILSRASTV